MSFSGLHAIQKDI